ncbi:MAG: AI-2E family transporter [Candidatus Endonucleobacter bathymodioli]|uniref:AI-2E family transporter n=1 Tax=Candidatus Endonucleibacter bathymodioli TaxID=539814 RepID=A0AA90NTY7_9GAMM|nr:AI-2E family transporter [Candidatus Endonucleobacter bathymodioli]MDP0590299.1 AI-2E family transporter [Candidatus Endonucleobacter bathymodioli]
MLDFIKYWLNRYLSDYEAMVLLVLLVFCFVIVLTMGDMLAPVFAALVLAFLMQGIINWLERMGAVHLVSVSLVFVGFVALLLIFLLVIVPLIWEQATSLLNEVPRMVHVGLKLLKSLPELYPGLVSESQATLIADTFSNRLAGLGQWVLSFLLSKLPGVLGLLIYLILVPLLIFFFLKDKNKLLLWAGSRLPTRRRLITQVADEMNSQIANYIRGKAIEIAIVSSTCFICFVILGLNYAVLLALMVGLSVVIPYIGATVVTVPVVIIGFFQWGFGNELLVLVVVYSVIQALDGNILVPLLFSEAVNLHPVAIIIAILVFGGLWGFWGVFFAIPLATLLKAVMSAWPKAQVALIAKTSL